MADPSSGLSDALKGVSGDALKSVDALNSLNKQMQTLVGLQAKAAQNANSNKGFLNAVTLQKATEKLIALEGQRLELSNKLLKADELSKTELEEITKAVADNERAIERNRATVLSAQKQVNDAYEATRKKILEANAAATENWKQNTLSGRAYQAVTGTVGKFAAGLTATALAGKALARVQEAAILQQDITLRNFRSLNAAQDVANAATGKMAQAGEGAAGAFSRLASGLGGVAGAAMDTATSFAHSYKPIVDLSTAIAETRATAILLGKDTGEVVEVMKEFARIAGTKNPEALKTLTEGAMVVSKVLQITTAEAVDYISMRMNKFGGSAQSAVIDLQGLYTSTTRINEEFGKTIIRGDDLARTMLEIGKDSSLYALDQRYLSDTMLTAIERLQSMGDSYDQARMKAKQYMEGLAGNRAPEFMKAMAGQDIAGQMTKALNADKTGRQFMEQFGNALEAAQPGLSAKIQRIAQDSTMPWYDKTRLIQEMVSGTQVGIEAMAKQMHNVYMQTGKSIEAGANIMGITREQYFSEMQVNEAFLKRVDLIHKVSTLSASALQMQINNSETGLRISQKEAEVLAGHPDLIAAAIKEQEKLNLITETSANRDRMRESLKSKIDETNAAIKMATDTLQGLDKDASEATRKGIQNEIEILTAKKNDFESALENKTQETVDVIDARITNLTKQMEQTQDGGEKERLAEEIAKLGTKKQQVVMSSAPPTDKAMYEIQTFNQGILHGLKETNDISGRTLASSFEKLASIENILVGGFGLAALWRLSKMGGERTNALLGLILAKIRGGGSLGGGGGGNASGYKYGDDSEGVSGGTGGMNQAGWNKRYNRLAGGALAAGAASGAVAAAAGAQYSGTETAVLGGAEALGALGMAVNPLIGIFTGLAVTAYNLHKAMDAVVDSTLDEAIKRGRLTKELTLKTKEGRTISSAFKEITGKDVSKDTEQMVGTYTEQYRQRLKSQTEKLAERSELDTDEKLADAREQIEKQVLEDIKDRMRKNKKVQDISTGQKAETKLPKTVTVPGSNYKMNLEDAARGLGVSPAEYYQMFQQSQQNSQVMGTMPSTTAPPAGATMPDMAGGFGGVVAPLPQAGAPPAGTSPAGPSGIPGKPQAQNAPQVQGEFVPGSLSADGSITMKVTNFMSAFAQANAMRQRAGKTV